jgi:hypothetical protein
MQPSLWLLPSIGRRMMTCGRRMQCTVRNSPRLVPPTISHRTPPTKEQQHHGPIRPPLTEDAISNGFYLVFSGRGDNIVWLKEGGGASPTQMAGVSLGNEKQSGTNNTTMQF